MGQIGGGKIYIGTHIYSDTSRLSKYDAFVVQYIKIWASLLYNIQILHIVLGYSYQSYYRSTVTVKDPCKGAISGQNGLK